MADDAPVDLMVPMPEPNAPTSSGAMYVAPTPGPALSPEQQTAMQQRLAAASSGPARAITPPAGMGGGVPVPDLSTIYQSAFSKLPVDQAGKVIEAAVRYQGQRGYQLDIQGGMAPDRAMVKWGPLLFHSAPGAFSAAMRGTMTPQQQQGPIQARPVLDEKGQPIPGQYFFQSGNRLERVQSGMTEAQKLAHQDRVERLAFDRKKAQDSLKLNQKLYALRQQEKELASDPTVGAEISPKASPERRKSIQAKKDRLQKVRDQIDAMISGVEPETAPSPAGTAPRRAAQPAGGRTVRVKSPEGKAGRIPEDQLDEALAAGYEEIK